MTPKPKPILDPDMDEADDHDSDMDEDEIAEEPPADTLSEYRALYQRYRPGLLKLAHGLIWRHCDKALAFALSRLAEADRTSDPARAGFPPEDDATRPMDSLTAFWAWMLVTEALIELEQAEGRA